MGKNSFTDMAESLLSSSGQDNHRGDASSTLRIIYTAIVRDTNDYAGLNRLKAEIVTLDENGNIKPGKDKDTPLDKLPICIPLIPEFVHVRPQVGEAVLIISENPLDLSSPRYWMGPVISQQTKLPYQSYTDASEIFKINTYSQKNTTSNPTTNNLNKAAVYFPQPSEIAFQGRQDADITFSPRSVIIRAGRFKKGTTDLNTATPCQIEIKQVDVENKNPNSIKIFDKLSITSPSSESTFKPYSQMNYQSTNINLYSLEGKFRKTDSEASEAETSDRLKDFGDIAKTLHPVAFADELAILLKLIIKYLIIHVHPPQSPALPNATSEQLQQYLTGTKMQDIMSNVIRVN
jgi:hypothetical protein